MHSAIGQSTIQSGSRPLVSIPPAKLTKRRNLRKAIDSAGGRLLGNPLLGLGRGHPPFVRTTFISESCYKLSSLFLRCVLIVVNVGKGVNPSQPDFSPTLFSDDATHAGIVESLAHVAHRAFSGVAAALQAFAPSDCVASRLEVGHCDVCVVDHGYNITRPGVIVNPFPKEYFLRNCLT